jgi:hypothetical protein
VRVRLAAARALTSPTGRPTETSHAWAGGIAGRPDLLCRGVAADGFLAAHIAWTGEFRAKGGDVVQLTPATTALVAGPLALMALVALWVAVSGRGD